MPKEYQFRHDKPLVHQAVLYNAVPERKVKRIRAGEYGRATMPHSEVCMHMRIAGKPMTFQFRITGYLNNGIDGIATAQLFDSVSNQYFSSPILASEAGIYKDNEGFYYYED